MDQTAIQNASPVFQNWVQGGPPMNRNRLSSGATDYSRDSLEGLHFLHSQTSPRLSHPMLEKSMEDDADRESPSLRKKLADGLRPLRKTLKRASKAASSELEESDEQYDTFEQDIDLSRTSRDITHSSEARMQPSHYHDQWSSQQTPEKHNFQQQHKKTYDNSNHDGGALIISSLSADDTNYELDDKTVKSIDASISNRSKGKTVNSRSSRQSKAGRDFNGAFDDLVEMNLNKKDLLDDSFDEIYEYQEEYDLMRQHEIRVQQSTPQHRKAISSVALDDVFEAQLYQQQRQQRQDLVDHRIKKPQHRRCVTSASTNLLPERPRPLHSRVSSEFPVSRPAPLSQFNRISSCGSSQHRTVAPHATLREVISAHNKVSDFTAASPGRRKLIPSTNRPLTLESARSTSNTVLSSTADTVASCPNQQLGVWNGFECGGSHPLNNSPKSFRRSQTFGPETPCHTTPCHRSMGSAATSLMSQDMYSMDKSSHSYIHPSSKYSLQGHVRSASESVNSQIQEATGEFDEESELTEETESTKKSIASSIRGELKYQLKKIVPSPLRKKMGRYPRNKVTFDRTGDGHLV